MQGYIQKEFETHQEVFEATKNSMKEPLEKASKLVLETLEKGNKILLLGNGGSAADAQHIAAEFINKYKKVRKALPAIALSTDTSALTSIGNDFGYEKVFARQIEALAKEGDLVLGISTSGNSKNVIEALKIAKKLECKTLGFSGNGGGFMDKYCDINLIVPSDNTPRIQEMHILFGHTICEVVDNCISS